MNHNIRQFKQQGLVSLFVVIFAALLMTVVTVGFIQLMIKDQQQATSSDLSQSAYDSAQAGVEDAKRLLLLDQACRNGTAGPSVNCLAVASALTPQAGESETSCDTLSQAGIVNGSSDETIIQQSAGDSASDLDQAYTCVKVVVNTDDYKGQVDVNQSDIVSIAGAADFDSVELAGLVVKMSRPQVAILPLIFRCRELISASQLSARHGSKVARHLCEHNLCNLVLGLS